MLWKQSSRNVKHKIGVFTLTTNFVTFRRGYFDIDYDVLVPVHGPPRAQSGRPALRVCRCRDNGSVRNTFQAHQVDLPKMSCGSGVAFVLMEYWRRPRHPNHLQRYSYFLIKLNRAHTWLIIARIILTGLLLHISGLGNAMIAENTRNGWDWRCTWPIAIPIFDQGVANLPAESGLIVAMVFEDFLLQLGRGVLVLITTNRSRFNRPSLLVPKKPIIANEINFEKAVLPALHVKPKQCSGSISNENNSLIPSKYPQALIFVRGGKKFYFFRAMLVIMVIEAECSKPVKMP